MALKLSMRMPWVPVINSQNAELRNCRFSSIAVRPGHSRTCASARQMAPPELYHQHHIVAREAAAAYGKGRAGALAEVYPRIPARRQDGPPTRHASPV